MASMEIFPTFVHVVFAAILCSLLVLTILNNSTENRTAIKSYTNWLDENQLAHVVLNCIAKDNLLMNSEDLDKLDIAQIKSCANQEKFGLLVKDLETGREWSLGDTAYKEVYSKFVTIVYPNNLKHIGLFSFYFGQVEKGVEVI